MVVLGMGSAGHLAVLFSSPPAIGVLTSEATGGAGRPVTPSEDVARVLDTLNDGALR